MKAKAKLTFLTAFTLAAVAGLGAASAQLLPIPIRAIGAAADDYPEGNACSSRIAIETSAGSVCSEFCTQHSDCPSAWGCRSVHQGNGEKARLCFPYR